jgi:hypothetical protein
MEIFNYPLHRKYYHLKSYSETSKNYKLIINKKTPDTDKIL